MLIAESGSTKTEWRLLEAGKVTAAFRSAGINPNVLSPEAIHELLGEALLPHLSGHPPGEVFFYGAGVRGDWQYRVMQEQLQAFFPHSRIHIEMDILAAARSTRREEGIICILGTGSNSAYHKAQQIVAQRGGLGYLFGDEGSGMDLGRQLIKGLLQEDFPDSVRVWVEEQTQKSLAQLRIDIHHSHKPNVKMAELSRLLGELTGIPSIRSMIVSRFSVFLDTTVCRYPDYRQLWVDFAGSIAHYFRVLLQEACESRQVRLGSIVKDPIDNLLEFHRHWQPG